jgi:hypothetical protein
MSSSNNFYLKNRDPHRVALLVPSKQLGESHSTDFSFEIGGDVAEIAQFLGGSVIPEVLTLNGENLARQIILNQPEAAPQRNQCGWGRSDGRIRFLNPSIQTKLLWQGNQLQLIWQKTEISIAFPPPPDPEELWSFSIPQPGIYQLRFIYYSANQEKLATTEFISLHMLEPIGANNEAIEVDGIRFETLVSEPTCALQPNTKLPISFGIRVINNTPNLYHFIFFAIRRERVFGGILPGLRAVSGYALQPGYARDATLPPNERDYKLVLPGEQLDFWQNAEISRIRDEHFYLKGGDGCGGSWWYTNLQPDTYRLHLMYLNCVPTGKVRRRREWREICDNVWVGKVQIPPASFEIKAV